MDKIRFPSFANGYNEGFGCFCPNCQEVFIKNGIDLPYIFKLIKDHDDILLQGDYDYCGHYLFKDEKVNKFYQVRAKMITNFVGTLCDYFHQRNLEVGLDIYAPFFAYHCGQDIYELSKKADFLKPMFYRFTQAPAGMQYEYDAYMQYFKGSAEFNLKPTSFVNLDKQCGFLTHAKCAVYPGIEVNHIEGICDTNVYHFSENRHFFAKYLSTIVCCWNCILMDDEIKNNL